MAGVNVSVAPEIINWVIEKIQFSTVNNSVFELLNKWKSGEKVPTFNQIEDVSKKTNKDEHSLWLFLSGKTAGRGM